MPERVILRAALVEQFHTALRSGRIVYFSAPCGFGKTVTAHKLLEGKNVRWCCAGQPGFRLPENTSGWQVLVVDDVQYLQEPDEQKALCKLLRENPERRFVLLSRARVPSWLIAFEFSGLMLTFDTRALLFDRVTTARLLQDRGVQPTEPELSVIQRETLGQPLAVALVAKHMAGGVPYSKDVDTRVRLDMFDYFNTVVYRRLDIPLRRFLLDLAPFETFDLELARMVSGNSCAGELLNWLQSNTSMLLYDDVQEFHFYDAFRQYLRWEMDREYPPEKQRALYDRGALYYELQGNNVKALECYMQGGDRSKVCDLLVRNAELHPGLGHYTELEPYYRSLRESEILASPVLMQVMSMISALGSKYEESERWYQELERFYKRCDRNDALRRQARGRLAWLDISLPQRSVTSMIDKFTAFFQLMTNHEILIPPFSVTSTLPSIMNGGKDFSDWSLKDEFLYKTLRVPVEAVLGKDGVGLGDCAIAESRFEKGKDIGPQMLRLVSRMSEVQKHGTPDIEFAIAGLLFRTQIDAGQPDEARRTLEAIRTRFEDLGQERFFGNIDACLCRVALYAGDLDAADSWYRDKAPRNPIRLNVMRRYQYLTQAMVELAEGKPEAVLLTLTPLEEYCNACARHIDRIQLNLLRAIALYRRKKSNWTTSLKAAVQEAEAYHFVRTISQFGAAVLPLLSCCKGVVSEAFLHTVMEATRQQTANYPDFLQPRLAPDEKLTATELQVLRLLCADKSNAEIGEILHIKLPTVKSHVSHILQKLGVSRRSEAKTAAQRLWLLSEES